MQPTGSPGKRKARVDAILKDGIDPHVHSGPSMAPRALDHLDLVLQMSEAGFAAVVTKDHDYAGVATAALIKPRARRRCGADQFDPRHRRSQKYLRRHRCDPGRRVERDSWFPGRGYSSDPAFRQRRD